MDDPRGGLALAFLQLAHRSRARWVVWENVPGVLSSNGGRDFGAFLGGLVELGYGFAYRVLDAQFFGVPQRRRRVFVVGHLGDWRRAAAVLFERHSLSGHPAPRRQAREDVALSPSLRAQSNSSHRADSQAFIPDVSPALKARDFKGPSSDGDGDGAPLIAHSLRAEGFDASEDGTGRGTPLVPVAYQTSGNCGAWETGAITGALDTNTDPNSHVLCFTAKDHGADAQDNLSPTLRAGGHSGSHANAGVMPAMAFMENQQAQVWETDCVQALNKGGGKPGQGYPAIRQASAVRRLTPRECERLQGFPDDFTLVPYRGKPAADGPRYKALGNSMAVPVVRWIGERIEAVEVIATGLEAAA
jgi:DNA (cytosine-5)-methyltransferase 1